MILFLHNRYRTTGGEERAVEDMMWLVREHLGEDAELLERDSAAIGSRQAATGLIQGGLDPVEVGRAVRRVRARVVHAHNVHPAFGWRALAAAREAGARVVMHLHQYRLVCAVGVCFTRGADCTRCHGRNTLPGIAHDCRGSRAEAVTYAAALALWQRRLVAQVDAFISPSRFAIERLGELGASLPTAHVVPHTIRGFAERPAQGTGGYALVAARLAAEKGIDVAIDACRLAAVELVVAGDGPLRGKLEGQAALSSSGSVRFVGRADASQLAELRREAAVALVPSLFAETFGLSAAEAMATGLPVAASRIGALPELVPDECLAPPGDAGALAEVITRLRSHPDAGQGALDRVRSISAPDVVAPALARVYDSVCSRAGSAI